MSLLSAAVSSGIDRDGTPYQVVVLGAKLTTDAAGRFLPRVDASIIAATDVLFDPERPSSVLTDADFVPEKGRVDVLVRGAAYAPGARPIERIGVSLRVADIDKQLEVVGDRTRSGWLGALNRPTAFTVMPIVYERALGGGAFSESGKGWDSMNPIGVGRSEQPVDGAPTDAPNVLYADGRDAAAGFGVVSRQWQPRLARAGTFDEHWLSTRWPLLPRDFDPRYYQSAPEDQQSDRIVGGEVCEVQNMNTHGTWRLRLPRLNVPVHLFFADRMESRWPRLDTFILEPDKLQVTVRARVKIPVVRRAGPLSQIVVGRVTPAWMRARRSGKRHVSWREAAGVDPGGADFLV